jgi:hypothetical protein
LPSCFLLEILNPSVMSALHVAYRAHLFSLDHHCHVYRFLSFSYNHNAPSYHYSV